MSHPVVAGLRWGWPEVGVAGALKGTNTQEPLPELLAGTPENYQLMCNL